MRVIQYFLLLLFVNLSCNNSGIKIEERSINMLAEGDFKLPSKYGFYDLFFLSEGTQIGTANVNTLHYVFLTYYSKEYKSFKLFLTDVLTQKIKISREKLQTREVTYLTLDDNVKKDYESVPFDEFISKYCQKSNANEFNIAKKYRNNDNLFTILYFLFINNYWVSFDDGIGEFRIASKP